MYMTKDTMKIIITREEDIKEVTMKNITKGIIIIIRIKNEKNQSTSQAIEVIMIQMKNVRTHS